MLEQVFKRVEKKFVITPEQEEAFLEIAGPYLEKCDRYKTVNNSLYFDTKNDYFYYHALEKPLFKEKLRIRAYDTPTLDSIVFIEMKKKYKGVGYKRRFPVTLQDLYNYLEGGELVLSNPGDEQLREEFYYMMDYYGLRPRLLLSYERYSYNAKDDRFFRLTFDKEIKYRTDNLFLEEGPDGELYFDDHKMIMEVKAVDAYPLWFVNALTKLSLYPQAFSKYNKIITKTKEVTNV